MDCSQLTAVSWWMKEEWVRGWVGGEGVVLVVSECVFLSAFDCYSLRELEIWRFYSETE